MSFNITSDGSPTPRKGPGRFSMASDLKIDTSPEVLGQAVGSKHHTHYPYTLYRDFGPSLTSGVQGMRRPLGASALGNQTSLPPQSSMDGSKVSHTTLTFTVCCCAVACLTSSIYITLLPCSWLLTK